MSQDNDEMNTQNQGLSTADLARAGERNAESANMKSSMGDGYNSEANAEAQKDESQATSLFKPDEARGYRSRWESIQTSFVDEPRQSVQQADQLVADAVKRLAESFADERSKLEQQWDRGDDVSTEDLRQALRRYRTFFDRLLSV